MCPLNLLHFLRGGPQAASQVRGHLAPDSAESGPAGGSSGSPPSHSPQVRGQGTPRGKSLSQHPQPPWAVAALTFPKVLQPPFGERGFLLGYGERGDTRCAVTRSPGVLPAFPSQSRAGTPRAAVTLFHGGPRLSAPLGLSLRGTREARGTGFHRHPRTSRVPAPLRLLELRAPDRQGVLSDPGVLPAGDGEPRSRPPGWV